MSRAVHDHAARPPARRLASDVVEAAFYPGEVARLLGLEGIEYDQLRRLFVLARVLRGDPRPGRAWSRFSLADLAATEVLVALGGGRERLQIGRHLILGDIETACAALRRLGIENPLLEVPMFRDGRRILAQIGQYVVEPITGQLALDDAVERLERYLSAQLIEDRTVRAAIARERQRLRLRKRLTIDLPGEDRGSVGVSLV